MSDKDGLNTPTGGEKCDRCGYVGDDRRTLWMACFYEMRELEHGRIPFGDVTLFALTKPVEEAGISLVKDATRLDLPAMAPKPGVHGGLPARSINLGGGEVKIDTPLSPHRLYTLRVCKPCRSTWLDAIAQWFLSQVPRAGYDDASNMVERP